jgi:hypothetical protein
MERAFGFIQFTMPADGRVGEGSLNIAARVKIEDARNRIVELLPVHTSPQRLTSVREEITNKTILPLMACK